MKVVILQPGFIPWLGFFDQMFRCDTFVIYDDVQYDKHGWRNRNRIKTPAGHQWLTVPVLTHNLNKPNNNQIYIDSNSQWKKKHLRSISQNYSKAPYFDRYYSELENIYNDECDLLLEFNMKLIYFLTEKLNITKKIIFSSELEIEGTSTQRLIDICCYLNASEYITGDSAKNYINEQMFSESNIKLTYHNYIHPVYPQLFGDFISHLSILDLLFNCGAESLKILSNQAKAVL